jgi:hypothetical protein
MGRGGGIWYSRIGFVSHFLGCGQGGCGVKLGSFREKQLLAIGVCRAEIGFVSHFLVFHRSAAGEIGFVSHNRGGCGVKLGSFCMKDSVKCLVLSVKWMINESLWFLTSPSIFFLLVGLLYLAPILRRIIPESLVDVKY